MANKIQTLLKPRWWGTLNQARGGGGNAGIVKLMIIGGLGAGFWVGALLICLRMLRYFSGVEQLGDILAWKFLSMVIVTIFSLLIFSSILNSLSKLYLAKDLKLVHALPVKGNHLFGPDGWRSPWTAPGWLFCLPCRCLFPTVWCMVRGCFFTSPW